MNMNMLMQQAQKMQKDIQKQTEELEKEVFTSKQELVELQMKGNKEVIKVKIDENVSKEDIEILEDMLLLAFNDAVNQIDKKMNEKLGKYKNIPGLF